MTFVTAANHRFKQHALDCVKSIESQGYEVAVFDLGGLGFGIPFTINDDQFQKTGCYKTHFNKWRSRAMHVCAIISRTMMESDKDEILVYMDADTRLIGRLDDIENMPFLFDVGITVRPRDEWEVLGRANSGVVFIRNNLASVAFLSLWQDATHSTGSIQVGLNMAAEQTEANVAEFQTTMFNNYHTPDNPPPGTKIIHYRASMEDK